MKLTKPVKRLLGVDPGLRSTGVVVFELVKHEWVPVSSALFETSKESSQYVATDNRRRLEYLSSKLAAIIREEKPTRVIAELPTGGAQSSRAAVAMSMAFSMVVLTCLLTDTPLEHVTPTEIKRHVAPDARPVSKEAVIQFVTHLYGSSLLPKGNKCEHVADAMACVSAYLNRP